MNIFRSLSNITLIGACALTIAGCSTTTVRSDLEKVYVTDETKVDVTPLAEALLARTGTVVQAISGSWKDRNFTAECVRKSDGRTMTAIFLAPTMRLATIRIDAPHTLSYTRAPQIPKAFVPEYALFDLALVNLDMATLASALGPSLSIVEKGNSREITANGIPVATLMRNPDGTLRLKNHIRGYSYTLKPLH